jgi:hypothetical protein
MTKVVDFIEHLECPSIDGIIFPDETIQPYSVEVEWDPPMKYNLELMPKTSIKILKEKEELWWSGCAILVQLLDQKHSIEIIAGEGSYGSDGFVSVMDLESKKTLWIAFFKSSNPFDQLKVLDGKVYATSTVGCIWKFEINNPIEFTVECGN